MTPLVRFSYLPLLTIATLAPNFALAEPILEVKKWTLNEVNSSSGVVCVAATKNDQIFRKETFHLEIRKLKNQPASPAEVVFKIENNKQGNTAAVMTIPSTNGRVLFTTFGGDSTWGFTNRLSDLVARLKSSEDSLPTKALGGRKEHEFEFNGRGFSAIIDAMETRCNGGDAIANREFDSLVTQDLNIKIDPTNINKDETSQLRNLYFAAFAKFKELKSAESGLAQVLAKYQSLINELSRVQARISDIQNSELPGAESRLTQALEQQRLATQELASLAKLIPQLESELSLAKRNHDLALANLAPHEPEHARLTAILNSVEQSLSFANRRLSEIDSRIPQLDSAIYNAKVETSELEQTIYRRNIDRNHAARELRDSEARLRQFDPQREIALRLRQNPQLDNLNRELQQLRQASQQSEQDLQRARQDKMQAEALLAQCKATSTPDKPADCSHQEQHLSLSNQKLTAIEMAKSDLGRREQETQNRIQEIERHVHQQVRNEHEQLRRAELEDRQRLNQLDEQINRLQQRLAHLRNSEIPSMERELYNLRMERPNVIAQISQLERDLDIARRNLAQFESSTGWESKVAAVRSTRQVLASSERALNAALSAKLSNERSLASGKNKEAEERGLIAALKNETSQLRTLESDLQNRLTQLPSERAPWDTKIADLRRILEQQKGEMQTLLN